MNGSLRFIMGIAVLAILAPAMATVMPGTLDDLTAWLATDEPALATVHDRHILATGQEEALIRATPAHQHDPPPKWDESQLAANASDTEDTKASNKAESDTSTRTSRPPEASSTDSHTTTTTSLETTPTTIKPETEVSGTITGTACPCTVTGTVELKGEISLHGDIKVLGGTLVARPGVRVTGNGFQFIFMGGGTADFQGTKVFTWSDNGSKQNLERDIVFDDMRRIMFMGAGKSILRYFTISNSGNAGVLGDYPLHFHLNGDSTRGTIVEGVVVINGQNHAFVPHGSHGITFKYTIAKNTRGDAYWWDPPGTNGSCSSGSGCDPIDNTNDVVYDHALADGVYGERGVAGFRLGAGNNPTVRNSAAINIDSSNPSKRFCSGFKWPEFTNGSSRGVNTVWTFHNNYSYSPSGCDGINVWQNDSTVHVIDGFSGGEIDHGAYSNAYHYKNVDVTLVIVHAAGWKMTDSNVDRIHAAKHRSDANPTVLFENVTVGVFTINNAADNGSIPGTYVFDGTNLTCGDIEYQSVVPGTRVIINGSEC